MNRETRELHQWPLQSKDPWGWAIFCTFTILSISCTLVNDIDVCKRELPPPAVISSSTDKDKTLEGKTSVAALPNNSAITVFTSGKIGDGGETSTEVRGKRIDATGQCQGTCAESEETIYAEPIDAGPSAQRLGGASLATPKKGDEVGLMAFQAIDDDDYEVRVLPFTMTGDVYLDHTPVVISEEEPGALVDIPSIVYLGDWKYAVVWLSILPDVDDYRLRARVLRVDREIEFMATVDTNADENRSNHPVDLTPSGPRISGDAATPLGGSSFAVTWTESTIIEKKFGVDIKWATFNDMLEQTSTTMTIYTGSGFDRIPAVGQPAIAWDDSQIFVAWQARDGVKGATRVFGRFLSRDGAGLSSPVSPDGKAFRVSDARTGEEEWVAITPLPDGGFVVAWVERGGTCGGTGRNACVMTRVFNGDREPQFINLSCSTASFPLGDATPGDHDRIALATLDDGSVVAMWTDKVSSNDAAREYNSVRAVVLQPRTLFPME